MPAAALQAGWAANEAVAQAERWGSNPTVQFLAGWARATGTRLELTLRATGPDSTQTGP